MGVTLLALVALALGVLLVSVPLGDEYPPAAQVDTSRHRVVAVFGATGLVGEGVFEALRRDPDVRMVHVVTRRRTPTIDAADDAIHSNGNITINNGTFTLATGDDGMHADATLTVNGGDITIPTSYEGLESAVITINAGDIDVTSSDDGINVAGGADGSGAMPGRGAAGAARAARARRAAKRSPIPAATTCTSTAAPSWSMPGATVWTPTGRSR